MQSREVNRAPMTDIPQENVKKVRDLVLQDRWVIIRQIIEGTFPSQYVVHNIFTELDMIVCKMNTTQRNPYKYLQ